MKKRFLLIGALFVICIGAIIMIWRVMQFPVSAYAVQLWNIEIESDQVSFEVVQTDSGYFLSGCTSNLGADGVLRIEFTGTLFRSFSKNIAQGRYVIALDEGAPPMKRIDIIGKGSVKTVWP